MEIYSSGKVLLTGEYVILDGALSLASPIKFGQHLKLEENQSNLINWKSINYDGKIWFECTIKNENLEIKSTSSKRVSDTLIRIINLIREYNPCFLKNHGSDILTSLTFDKNWGLGSSSTLISNLAKLSGVDPYVLNNKIFKGLDAFLIVWGEIPRYRILAKFASIPGIYHIGWLIYEFIALILFYKNRYLLRNE